MHDLWFPVPNTVDRDVDRKTTEKHSVWQSSTSTNPKSHSLLFHLAVCRKHQMTDESHSIWLELSWQTSTPGFRSQTSGNSSNEPSGIQILAKPSHSLISLRKHDAWKAYSSGTAHLRPVQVFQVMNAQPISHHYDFPIGQIRAGIVVPESCQSWTWDCGGKRPARYVNLDGPLVLSSAFVHSSPRITEAA